MLITLRLPRSSALRLNLTTGDVDQQEVVTTLTAVELAGRLSLATGKAIGPEAVVRYGVAWRSATETLHRLLERHGEAALARMVRKACRDSGLWTPRGNAAMLKWLQCVLESHFLSGGEWPPATPMADAPPAGQHQTDDDQLVAETRAGQMLAHICKENFPLAHLMWSKAAA